jgi:uncharacterized membrane protein YvbJ
MAYCPKCGNKIEEEMVFCPKCGATLKAGQAPSEPKVTAYRRNEKSEKDEKNEKQEKDEKSEKHEKRGYSFVGPLIGGLVLIFIGLASFLQTMGMVESRMVWAFFLVAVGVLVMVGAIIGVAMAGKRHPKP